MMADLSAPPGRGKNPTNRTDDIDGAQPRSKFVYSNPDWKEEIEGSRPQPSKHHKFLNKPDSFQVRDIEGAKAKKSHFRTTRCVNPLHPEYELPSSEPIVYEEPRFIRDSFDVSDIEGTKTRVAREYETRNSYDVSDIEGTSASWAPWHKIMIQKVRAKYGSNKIDPLHVRDITEQGFKSRRSVDPQRPVYFIHGNEIRDCARGTAPRKLFKQSDNPFFSLHTKDIHGADGGSASVFRRLRVHERTIFRDTNKVSDISGATTGTLRRGLRSKRQTDPLQPNYRFLHGAHTPTPPEDYDDGSSAQSFSSSRSLKKSTSKLSMSHASSMNAPNADLRSEDDTGGSRSAYATLSSQRSSFGLHDNDDRKKVNFSQPGSVPHGKQASYQETHTSHNNNGNNNEHEQQEERKGDSPTFSYRSFQSTNGHENNCYDQDGHQTPPSNASTSSSRPKSAKYSQKDISGRGSKGSSRRSSARGSENPLSARSAPSSRQNSSKPPPIPLHKIKKQRNSISQKSSASLQSRHQLGRQADIDSVRDLPEFDEDI